jgi:hypothetical protein
MISKIDTHIINIINFNSINNQINYSKKEFFLEKNKKKFINRKFGKLVILEIFKITQNSNSSYNYFWKCQCDCGNICIALLDSLKKGKTKSCGCGRKGKGHYKYNKNLTDEERLIKRNTPEFKKWASDVKKRDDYICQICLQKGKRLNSHHLYSWSKYKDLRYDLDNGVTLCLKHHKEFHHLYGNDCTKEQFLEFKENYEKNINNI